MEMHMEAKHVTPKHAYAVPFVIGGVDGRVAERLVSHPVRSIPLHVRVIACALQPKQLSGREV